MLPKEIQSALDFLSILDLIYNETICLIGFCLTRNIILKFSVHRVLSLNICPSNITSDVWRGWCLRNLIPPYEGGKAIFDRSLAQINLKKIRAQKVNLNLLTDKDNYSRGITICHQIQNKTSTPQSVIDASS